MNASIVNRSPEEVKLASEHPVSPCDKYYHYNYRLDPDSGPVYDYNQCLLSSEYLTYERKLKEYEEDTKNAVLKLMTPKNQICDIDSTYQATRREQNIGGNLTYETLQPQERKTGIIVFKCPENKGTFKIQYKDSAIELNI